MASAPGHAAERLEAVKRELTQLKAEKAAFIKQQQKTPYEFTQAATKVDITNRKCLSGHFGKVYALDWARDPNVCLSASNDGKLIIWNAYTSNKMAYVSLRSAWVMTCSVDKETDKMIACGGLDNQCSIYALPETKAVPSADDNKPKLELTGHDGYLSSCKFLPDGKMLTGSGDSTCGIWDLRSSSSNRKTFSDHSADVMTVAPKPDAMSDIFASGSCDMSVKIWDARSKSPCVNTLVGPRSDVNSVEWIPGTQSLAFGCDEGAIFLFDIRSPHKELNSFSDPSDTSCVTDISFSSTGRFIFAGYDTDKRNVKVWETICKADEGMHVLGASAGGGDKSVHTQRVSCLGVNSSGTALATGSWDQQIYVWA